MALVLYTNNPTTSDTVLIQIQTTDINDNLLNPYEVSTVTVYFISRDYTIGNVAAFVQNLNGQVVTTYYTAIQPVQVYGTEDQPAWLSTDIADAFITQITQDDQGNPLTGTFQLQWIPGLSREGDYIVCWSWIPIPGADALSDFLSFSLSSDTEATTSIPTHVTPAFKYRMLLDKYLPQFIKNPVSNTDLTYNVINRFNNAVGDGFKVLEDLANQVLDLQDANVIQQSLLPYLSNFFQHKLRSQDPQLWRRQVKEAIPTLKMKGTLAGLTMALDQAGIKLNSVEKLWQVVSQATWQDAFIVQADQNTFVLSRTALLPVNSLNFEVYLRPNGSATYTQLDLSYVQFTTTTAIWVGETLLIDPIAIGPGDVVRVIYQYAPVANQAIENYIRSLPLMDLRDETTFIYPLKNWNVRAMTESDPMFSLVIPMRHPYKLPVVWGKVRTEFAYSEQIYNMDEYNGSLRDSIDPCNIDRPFLDVCTDCQGSGINVSVEIDELSDDRLTETEQIIQEYVPFHAQIHSIEYSGAINEYFVPPVENVEMLIDFHISEHILVGQSDFARIIYDAIYNTGEFIRDQLSTAVNVASGNNAIGFNDSYVLYCPGVSFDSLGIKPTNLLEILSGPNVGQYAVSNPRRSIVDIDQGSPDSISFGLDTSQFAFRLSNLLFSTNTASITQDNLYLFSDVTESFSNYQFQTVDNSPEPWNLVVTSGAYAGTYVVQDILPNDTLIIQGWVSDANTTNLLYKITNNDNTQVIIDRSSDGQGAVNVTWRGLVSASNLQNNWGIRQGDYVLYDGNFYQITSFLTPSQAYISNYQLGSAAGVTVEFYRRLLDNGVGFLDVRGMYIITTTDYESFLNVQNGSNPPPVPVENSSFMANFLILINGNYYQVAAWDATRIDLIGPTINWGVFGTSGINYTIVQFEETLNPSINGITFQRLDRRGLDFADYSIQQMIPMELRAAALNKSGSNIIETMGQLEQVSFQIIHKDGSVEQHDL